MKKDKVLGILKRAMDIERQGKAFYQEATEHVGDPMGKRVFGTLAKEEVEHLRLLQTEYEAIHNDQAWVELSEAKTREPTSTLQLFPDKRDTLFIIPADASDLDALSIAMEFETKGYNMYHQAEAEVDDPHAKGVFSFLAQQENDHYVFLQKTHEYLTTEGAWYFDEREFPFFEG